MKIIDDDKNQMKNSSKKQYIPLYYHSIKNRSNLIIKLIISIIILVSLFLISLFIIRCNKNKIKTTLSSKSTNNNEQFIDELKLIVDKEEILENELMKKHTTFQLGGPAKYFIKPKSINKIIKIIQMG